MKFKGRFGPAALGLCAVLLFPVLGFAADDGVIRGTVRDSSGVPVIGALVTASGPMVPERSTFTDRRGAFSMVTLRSGEYSVRVVMPRYLPVLQNGIHLTTGATATLTVTLQTSMDVVRRAASHDAKESQDIVWVLRSSRSTQPVLRLMDTAAIANTATPANSSNDYSGFFQIYSKSVETSAGAADTVGSHFSVTMPLQSNAKVTLAGQYNELPSQPRGVSALYEFKPAERRHTQVGVNARQGTLLVDGAALKEVQLQYKERLESFEHFVLDYGAEAGRADQTSSHNYIRPRFGVSWTPDSRTVIGVSATSQAPTQADDPIRGKNYFEQVYLPPALEKYSHAEVNASRFLSDDTKVSVGIFRDRIDNHALFVNAAGDRNRLMIFDGRNLPTQGIRAHVSRDFRGVDAGIGYTVATGIGVSNKDATTLDEVRNSLIRQRFHVVTARIKTDVDATNTEVTAVYRWASNVMAAPIDAYQSLVEYNDPTLSITVAQNLPTWRTFPGKIQAIVDARNLLEPPFSPHRAQFTPAPRLMKGGINIRF
jgi:hypothetical protein